MISTIILKRSSSSTQASSCTEDAVSNPSLLACPEEASSAHKEHVAFGKSGSKPHSKDVLTPNPAMQWRRKSLLVQQLPGKTQIALLGKGSTANGIAEEAHWIMPANVECPIKISYSVRFLFHSLMNHELPCYLLLQYECQTKYPNKQTTKNPQNFFTYL